MFGLGTWELLLIFLAILVLFGAKRLPSLGRGLGEGLRSFKDGLKSEPKIEDTPQNHKDDAP